MHGTAEFWLLCRVQTVLAAPRTCHASEQILCAASGSFRALFDPDGVAKAAFELGDEEKELGSTNGVTLEVKNRVPLEIVATSTRVTLQRTWAYFGFHRQTE